MYKTSALILILIFALSVAYAGQKHKPAAKSPSTGHVASGSLSIHSAPSGSSDIQGLLGRGSSVTILGRSGGWYKIKLMDGGTGYVPASSVTTGQLKPQKAQNAPAQKNTKQPQPASAPADNSTGGSVVATVKSMLSKFNSTVLASDFANEKKILPSLSFSGMKGNNSLVLLYSAMDQSGKKVPSLLGNPLAKNMRELIELSFLKMLKTGRAGSYIITVESPYFGEGGKINGSVNYAVFTLKAQDKDIDALEHNKMSVWGLIKSSRKLSDVFSAYPH